MPEHVVLDLHLVDVDEGYDQLLAIRESGLERLEHRRSIEATRQRIRRSAPFKFNCGLNPIRDVIDGHHDASRSFCIVGQAPGFP